MEGSGGRRAAEEAGLEAQGRGEARTPPFLFEFRRVQAFVNRVDIVYSNSRYRKMQKNAPFLAIGGVDTAENEPYDVRPFLKEAGWAAG